MRSQPLAVDTHNRKIRRIRNVFDALADYRGSDNPFASKTLMRKAREEQNATRRRSFSREQGVQLLAALDDPTNQVKNKHELRVLYILGTANNIIDKYYTHVGGEAQEKAIQMLSGSGVPAQKRIQKALEYLASLDSKSEELQKIEEILHG